ncbi:MAG TPA: hypothetical protein VF086_02935, partial [Propionibacteriaceae bacterium]
MRCVAGRREPTKRLRRHDTSEASPLTAEPGLASSTGRGSGRGNMAALCAGDVTVQLVPPSH